MQCALRQMAGWLALTTALLGDWVTAHPLGTPPGDLVEVQGTRMHLYCEGSGRPTVIFDSGLGGASLEWMPVMRQVATFTQACTYDRAGYGWSDMGTFPRTSSQEVDELYLLLTNSGHRGPFLLVGHSFGGYNVQLFARRYAYLTAGLVLVDASHPEQIERFQAPPYNVKTAPSSRFGLVQFGNMPPVHQNLSSKARLLTLYQFKNWKPRRTMSYELLGFRDSAREVREAQAMPPVPLVVVSRGKRVWPNDERGDRLEQLWISLQSELAAQSPASAHLLARASGHMVHLEQPELVAYAIALVFDAVRNSGEARVAEISAGRATMQFDRSVYDTTWLKDALELERLAELKPAATVTQ